MGVCMKSAVIAVLLVATATGLAGCGSTMSSYLEKETPAQTAAVRSDLTMPPDLRLPQPGTTAAAPDTGAAQVSRQASLTTPPAAAPSSPVQSGAAATTTAAATPPSNSPDSVYTQAGISVYKADGTRKSDAELRKELQDYYRAQKKAQNPNYGTVFNIGNIFKDE